MKQIRPTPKNYERHPLSKDYEDLDGRPSARMEDKIKRFGQLDGFPIWIWEGKIIDGWQRYLTCKKTGKAPTFKKVKLPEGMSIEEWVEATNDDRRHEDHTRQARRAEARRERVKQARKDGNSLQSIADKEKVSKKTIINDLSKSGGDPSPPEDDEGEIQDSEEEYQPTVTGKDGKTYSATKTKKKPPANGAFFDKKAFLDAWGALSKHIGIAGSLYGASRTPGAEGIKRLLDEWKAQFLAWVEKLAKDTKGRN